MPRFEQAVCEHAGKYRAVDGLAATDDGAAQIGPMVSEMQRQIVHRQVEAAMCM